MSKINPDIVKSIIERLQSRDSISLVHIDQDPEFSFDCIKDIQDVHFTSFTYLTPWGSPELAFAVLDGLKESLRLYWDYACMLSESDYPVKSPVYIAEYLHKSDKDHILINALPCINPLESPGVDIGSKMAEEEWSVMLSIWIKEILPL